MLGKGTFAKVSYHFYMSKFLVVVVVEGGVGSTTSLVSRMHVQLIIVCGMDYCVIILCADYLPCIMYMYHRSENFRC